MNIGYRVCDVDLHPAFHNMHVAKTHEHKYLLTVSNLVFPAFSTIPISPFIIQRIFHSLVQNAHTIYGTGRLLSAKKYEHLIGNTTYMLKGRAETSE